MKTYEEKMDDIVERIYQAVMEDFDLTLTEEEIEGLTYDYMRDYIRNNESKENVESALSELEHLIEISKCHSSGYRYPTIKKWFLEKYEDVAAFGKEVEKDNENEETEERKTVELSFPKEESVAA